MFKYLNFSFYIIVLSFFLSSFFLLLCQPARPTSLYPFYVSTPILFFLLFDIALKHSFLPFQGVYVKPFCMAMALMLFQQLSGINAVIFNLQTVFNSAGTSDEPAGISSFAVCAVQVVLYNDKKANVCDNHLFQMQNKQKVSL